MRRPRRARRNPPDPIRAFGEAINQAIDGFFQHFADQFDPVQMAEAESQRARNRADWEDWIKTSAQLRDAARHQSPAKPNLILSVEERKLLDRLLSKGYRQLARDLHPDAGGSDLEMRRLNALMDKLKK